MLAFFDLDYVIAILPLALAQLAVPPITYVLGLQDIPSDTPVISPLLSVLYKAIPQSFYQQRHIVKMMLRDNARHIEHFSPQHITHLFVHKDFEHLFHNVMAMFVWGQRVFRETSDAKYLYALFLSGGIFASMPYGEKWIQSLAVPEAHTSGMTSQAASSMLSSLWSKVSDVVVKPATDYLKQIVSALGLGPQIYCCGSSGAVSALMGCSFVYEVRDLIEIVGRFMKIESEGKGKESTTRTVSRKSTVDLVIRGIVSIPKILYVFTFVSEEFLAIVFSSLPQEVSMTSWLSWFAPKDTVNHAAHLQGIAFGAAVGIGSLLLPKLRRF